MYRQKFAVEFDYAVYFTEALFAPHNPVFVDALTCFEPARRHRFVVFIDEQVAAAWPRLAGDISAYAARHAERLDLAATPEIVAGGEQVKNSSGVVERLQWRLMELGIDRHSFVVAIGGGAMLDVVGYVAATTHRGIRLIRVPTTVLAQNDSGVGVKNGYNAFGVKNFVGTFAPPFAVLTDLQFITTLEPRDKIAGMAEAVKVALIRDAGFFGWLEAHALDLGRFDPPAMAFMIRRCAELHMRHIATSGDPFEMGSARPLDYGHWAAHKLEVLTAHALRHGEAVAIGMALDARYAVRCGMLAGGADERICRLLETLGFRLWHPALAARTAEGGPSLLAGLREFREHLGGELTVTLLTAIGRSQEVHDMAETEIMQAVAWLRERDGSR
ncbi:MAG: 3-dehydroquinate synthase [Pseudomonadota bacterium]